jgi:transposase InsO family protein
VQIVEIGVIEQRYRAVMEVLEGGIPVMEAAARIGVSRQTMHKWIHRFIQGGRAALGNRSHRPKSCPHQIDSAIEAAIVKLRGLHPRWGPVRIAYELAERGFAVPSESAIYRCLLRHQLIPRRGRRRRRRTYRSFERSAPMKLWQMDVTAKAYLSSGRELRIITVVDDHSRFCLGATVVERTTHRAIASVLLDALGRFGVPDEILTDNGIQFTARFNPSIKGELLFERICREHGITHILTTPGHPTTTGKVERFHQSLQELTSTQAFADVRAAQLAVDRYVTHYNHERPHRSLGMTVPASRFSPGTATPLDRDRPPPAEQVDSVPVLSRRVDQRGKVNAADERCPVGRALAGESVLVEVHDHSLEIIHEGRHLRSHPRTRKEVKRLRSLEAHIRQR